MTGGSTVARNDGPESRLRFGQEHTAAGETNPALATPAGKRGTVFDSMELQLTPTATPTRMTAWLERAWLVQYLDRQLSGEENAWFESYSMDKPDLLAGIESDTRLRDALAADATARHTERSAARGSRQGGAAHPARVRTRLFSFPTTRTFPARQLALAASFVAALGLGWIGSAAFDGARRPAEVIADPTRLIYDTMRGEAMPPRIEHAGSRSPFVVVEFAVPPSASGIVLKSDHLRDQTLTPSPDGFVSFVVPRTYLTESSDAQIEYRLDGADVHKPLRFPQAAMMPPR
jgi:hypothetical protein